jgi:hypothetical protein
VALQSMVGSSRKVSYLAIRIISFENLYRIGLHCTIPAVDGRKYLRQQGGRVSEVVVGTSVQSGT